MKVAYIWICSLILPLRLEWIDSIFTEIILQLKLKVSLVVQLKHLAMIWHPAPIIRRAYYRCSITGKALDTLSLGTGI